MILLKNEQECNVYLSRLFNNLKETLHAINLYIVHKRKYVIFRIFVIDKILRLCCGSFRHAND